MRTLILAASELFRPIVIAAPTFSASPQGIPAAAPRSGWPDRVPQNSPQAVWRHSTRIGEIDLEVLPQEASVFRKLSAEDNLLAILELRKDLDVKARLEILEHLLDEFHLQGVRKSKGERLSGGERRRLEIARALATEPGFMLLDEPFAGVDPISVNDIKSEIRDLAQRDIGVLITDHNVRDTLDICDRAYIVNEGHIIAEGEPGAILADQQVRNVYLGDSFRL